jgi:hypothetical protein
MQVLQEVTQWECQIQPNHTYLVDGDRIIAYRKLGKGEAITCTGKFKIDRRGRKFVKLGIESFPGFEPAAAPAVLVEVKGSRGDVYQVNVEEKTCTCQGFLFRGRCKHIEQAIKQ